jgi:hypothetical protein
MVSEMYGNRRLAHPVWLSLTRFARFKHLRLLLLVTTGRYIHMESEQPSPLRRENISQVRIQGVPSEDTMGLRRIRHGYGWIAGTATFKPNTGLSAGHFCCHLNDFKYRMTNA